MIEARISHWVDLYAWNPHCTGKGPPGLGWFLNPSIYKREGMSYGDANSLRFPEGRDASSMDNVDDKYEQKSRSKGSSCSFPLNP
ncbi:hypothetical protein L6164_012194 [Bauhinia variegata]|uniref:Uncharacterized protein n=1 Tax=Bauhinia variegata TaxID=167791 RepID=A0ACB9P8E9_BAUVA|nr:hypothetical protein L6164_012194 [Bauhinia variegata]